MPREARPAVEHTIPVQTHGRYLVSAGSGQNAPLLIGFHGYGETAEEELARLFTIPGTDRWTLVSVQGLHRFYRRRTNEVVASWMTRQNRELAIDDNVAYVLKVVDLLSREYTASPTVVLICKQFPEEEFYVSEEAAADAVRHRSQFNIIHPRSGLKVDVIIPTANEFNKSRFLRASRVQAGEDWTAAFSSPEDAIIKKMEYFREGGSEKHLRDITGVLKTSGEAIDIAYIDRWAAVLDLTDIWQDILQRLHLRGS
jgi:hypothetical protein